MPDGSSKAGNHAANGRPRLAHAAWASLAVLCTAFAALALTRQRDDAAAMPIAGIEVAELTATPGLVTVRPNDSPRGAYAGVDAHGRPITIACMVCHATRTPNPDNAQGSDLDEFHQGLVTAHAGLTCLSCHNASDYGSLRRADGQAISFARVQSLCAQCHGQTVRSYENGAHGGMVGYWDLTRGGRIRNGCLDCHDPHAPAIPRMLPTFKPRDRFLEGGHD